MFSFPLNESFINFIKLELCDVTLLNYEKNSHYCILLCTFENTLCIKIKMKIKIHLQ